MFDVATGQYYLRARFYHPEIGRFMQEDVYRGDGLNLYAYCANNPVMYYDPSGYGKKSNKVLCLDGKAEPGTIQDEINYSQVDEIIDNIPGKFKQNGQCDSFAEKLVRQLQKKVLLMK